jgi:hypothetical protein
VAGRTQADRPRARSEVILEGHVAADGDLIGGNTAFKEIRQFLDGPGVLGFSGEHAAASASAASGASTARMPAAAPR